MSFDRTKLSKLVRVLSLVVFLAMLAIPVANSQELKVGYIDPRVILNGMPEAKAIQQRIQNLVEKKQQELAEKQQELQTEIELYQQKVGVISEQARQEEEERLTLLDQEFRQFQSEAQQEIQQQSSDLMAPLLEKIQTSVNSVAAQQGLDLVLNISTSGYGILDRTIIQISPEHQEEYNITSSVIEDLEL